MVNPGVAYEALIKNVCRCLKRCSNYCEQYSVPDQGTHADLRTRQQLAKLPCHREVECRRVGPVGQTSFDTMMSSDGANSVLVWEAVLYSNTRGIQQLFFVRNLIAEDIEEEKVLWLISTLALARAFDSMARAH